MVNRGEEEVWVQMNVVPRSTGNTNSGTRELTLKCKLKCYYFNLHFRVNSLVPLFLKIVHQKGLFDAIKKNPNFPNCGILDIYWQWFEYCTEDNS